MFIGPVPALCQPTSKFTRLNNECKKCLRNATGSDAAAGQQLYQTTTFAAVKPYVSYCDGQLESGGGGEDDTPTSPSSSVPAEPSETDNNDDAEELTPTATPISTDEPEATSSTPADDASSSTVNPPDGPSATPTPSPPADQPDSSSSGTPTFSPPVATPNGNDTIQPSQVPYTGTAPRLSFGPSILIAIFVSTAVMFL